MTYEIYAKVKLERSLLMKNIRTMPHRTVWANMWSSVVLQFYMLLRICGYCVAMSTTSAKCGSRNQLLVSCEPGFRKCSFEIRVYATSEDNLAEVSDKYFKAFFLDG